MPHSRAHIRSNRHASSDLYANNHSHEHGHGNPRANRHTNDDGNPGFIQGYRCAARDRNSAAPPQPPREGGTWDFEGGWYDSPSGFEGRMDRVAEDWKLFRQRGQFGQATFNENKNPVNVHRGIRSQELAFESSDGEAGVYRSLQVIPNHRYTISAWGIHYPSPTPIELYLGVDLTGGTDYRAATMQWSLWRETADAQWLHTEVTIRTTSPTMAIFLKAVHRVAAGGGATLFDDVSVTDLGE
jgi:hypothetical protein